MKFHKDKLSLLAELAIPFTLSLTLYASTICGVSIAANDSIAYINRIDTAKNIRFSYNPLFHPHHLLYNGFAKSWIYLCKLLGFSGDTAYMVSLLNAIFGALTLAVFYLILRQRLNHERAFALIGTVLPAFSFGFWFYSVSVEVYIIPLFFLLLCLYFLTSDSLNEKGFAVVGLLHSVSVLFYQINILFIPVIYLAAKRKNLQTCKLLTSYAHTFFPMVIIPYLIIMTGPVKLRTIKDAWFWITGYAKNPGFWKTLSFSTIINACIGFGRSIIGACFIFAIPQTRALMDGLFKGGLFLDEVFLVHTLGKTAAYVFLILSAIAFALIIVTLFLSLKKRIILEDNSRNIFSLTALWFGIYTVFFCFWVPINLEFWIPQSICLWLMLLTACSADNQQSSGHKKISLSIIAALIFTVNWGGSIRYLKDKHNDIYYLKSSSMFDRAQGKDLIIISPVIDIPTQSWDSEPLFGYLLRHTKANVIDLFDFYKIHNKQASTKFINRLQKIIDSTLARGNTVYIYKETLELKGKNWRSNEDKAVFDNLWNQYKANWQQLDSTGSTIYLLKATGSTDNFK